MVRKFVWVILILASVTGYALSPVYEVEVVEISKVTSHMRRTYIPVKVKVTNKSAETRSFITDDDCGFDSWIVEPSSLEIGQNLCTRNGLETQTLAKDASYEAAIRVELAKKIKGPNIRFRVGFVETWNGKKTAPVWSTYHEVPLSK